jgi:putative spermidine/putrescine transport system permease protein
MHFTRTVRVFFGGLTWLVLAFLYVPLLIVAVLSFNTVASLSWPPKGFTLHWWRLAAHSSGARDALIVSLKTAIGATAIALVLGLLAALAIHRFKFFGRESLNLMIVLPIALPGIVTGISLNAAFRQVGFEFGLLTLIIAHATFCIVVLYNNMLARFRRLSPNLEEASADLGAHTFQTFRYVTFPLLRTALLAGGLLAFGLSFDEIVVTTFAAGAGLETLPIWIFRNLSRGEQQPIVTVVATVVMVLSIIPVWVAQRLTSDDGPLTGGTR